jgi:hypothetical protein
MSQTLPTKKAKPLTTGLVFCILIVIQSAGMAAERLWDRSRIPKDNFALQYAPSNAAQIHFRLSAIRRQIPKDRNQKVEIDFLSEPGLSEGIGALLDFYCLGYIYFLEGEAGDGTSPFSLTHGKSQAQYRKEYDDFDRLSRAWGISYLDLSGITSILERLNDERALPILARVFFFTAKYKPMGDDSGYPPPGSYAYLQMLNLLRDINQEQYATFPKADHTMWNKNHYDEIRKWILANKATLLPDGVPKIANVQEGPFLEYIAKKEAAERANPELMETYEPYNGVRTPENRRRILIGAAVLVGVGLLFLLVRLIRKSAEHTEK